MIFWIKQLNSLSHKEKITLVIFFIIQLFMAYRHFFLAIDNITWNESIFSLILVIPWILSLTFYLNFKFLPFQSVFLRIRLSFKQKIIETIKTVIGNLLLSAFIPTLVAFIALLSKGISFGSLILMLEIVIRYILFLSIASALQIIFMTIFKNTGIVSVLFFLIFFIGSYIRNGLIVTFLYPALYPANFTLQSLLLAIGYEVILWIIYLSIEAKMEYL